MEGSGIEPSSAPWATSTGTHGDTGMRLTDKACKASKPQERPYKLSDGLGLFLLVKPDGGKLWRFRFTFGGKESTLSFGAYPEITLKRARQKRRDARDQLDRGINPSTARKEARRAARAERAAELGADSFQYVALEYLLLQAGKPPPRTNAGEPVPLSTLKKRLDDRLADLEAGSRSEASRASTLATMHRRLEKFVFPSVGKRALREITGPELLDVIRRIEARGTHETAHRTLAACGRVFKYGVSTGRAQYDAAASIDRRVLVKPDGNGFAAITDPKRIGELLRAIDGYEGQPGVMAALKLAPLVFVRPGELRAAEWSEFDLEATIDVDGKTEPAPEWRIPAERMKLRTEHVVPLSTQAVAILEELKPWTGHGRFCFPSLRSPQRPISENTLNAALRRLGFGKDEMTAHGFRSMASTRLNEMGWHPDVIELQLAHAERNKVRAAYNRAQRLAERRAMMTAWSNYLDQLKNPKSNVTAIGDRKHA